MRVLFCYADYPNEWNTSEWRCIIPADSINRLEGHRASLVHIDGLSSQSPTVISLMRWADVVVIERNFWGPVINAVRSLKQLGKLVIADFDDNYGMMTAMNPAARHWVQNLHRSQDGSNMIYGPGFLNEWKACLREFHAYHTPSKVLTSDWQGLNSRGYVVNNHPDYNWPSWNSRNLKPSIPLIVGWGGGQSHYESFSDSKVITALHRLCEQHPGIQVGLITADQRLPKLLGLPPTRFFHHRGVPLHLWPALVTVFDIGFVPLAGAYDDRRSHLKVLELGARGIPWVAIDRPPYYGCPGGILIKDETDAWVENLSKLITDKKLRKKLGREGRKWARNQSIEKNVHERLGLYKELLEKLRAGELDKKPQPEKKPSTPRKRKKKTRKRRKKR